MKRRFRLVIEYELDDPNATLDSEREAWLEGQVDVLDIVGADDTQVNFELIVVEE